MPTVPYRTSDYLNTPDAIAEYLNVVLETRKATIRIC